MEALPPVIVFAAPSCVHCAFNSVQIIAARVCGPCLCEQIGRAMPGHNAISDLRHLALIQIMSSLLHPWALYVLRSQHRRGAMAVTELSDQVDVKVTECLQLPPQATAHTRKNGAEQAQQVGSVGSHRDSQTKDFCLPWHIFRLSPSFIICVAADLCPSYRGFSLVRPPWEPVCRHSLTERHSSQEVADCVPPLHDCQTRIHHGDITATTVHMSRRCDYLCRWPICERI